MRMGWNSYRAGRGGMLDVRALLPFLVEINNCFLEVWHPTCGTHANTRTHAKIPRTRR